MNITFRHALADDIDVIVDFNVRLALETEDKQLPVDVVRKGVAAALQQARKLATLLQNVMAASSAS